LINLTDRTFAADGWEELSEPLDLGVQRAVVPNLVAEADGVEEVEAHGGGADDGHVRALLEVAAGLGRRQQRQPKVLGCPIRSSASQIPCMP